MRIGLAFPAFLALLACGSIAQAQDIVVGSKNFTESRLLGEIVTQFLGLKTDLEVEHTSSLGGTKVCWNALRSGEIDIYVDYTGTGWSILLGEEGRVADPLQTFLHVRYRCLKEHDVEWLTPFGLNNTYALALRREQAESMGVKRISDLVGRGSELKVGFGIEFMNREDGWAGLKLHYPGLDFSPRSVEHGLAYEALERGQIDLLDAYSTDAKLRKYDVVVLEDDLGFFPPYNAAPLVRGEALRSHPEIRDALQELAFTISDVKAIELNYRVEEGGESFEEVARSFIEEVATASELEGSESASTSGYAEQLLRLGRLTLEHLFLVVVAVMLAALLAIPLGVLITRHPRLRPLVLGGASVLQTIPSLALLAFLITIPWFGLGTTSAVVALLLYAILPIVRNTVTGLDTADPDLIDAARGLGLTPGQVLRELQLPLASRAIFAGVRTASVISVGVATLAAFIGAGGLGQPIIEGLYLNDTGLILFGAVPSALLALSVDALLHQAEKRTTSKGLLLDED